MEQRMAQIAREREMAKMEFKQEAQKYKDPEEDFKKIDMKYQQTHQAIQYKVSKCQLFAEDRLALEKHFEDLYS